jgi:hypothetical protein
MAIRVREKPCPDTAACGEPDASTIVAIGKRVVGR